MADWDAVEHAVQSAPNNHMRWAVKYASGSIPIADSLKKYRIWPSYECPRVCGDIKETARHIILCGKADSLWVHLATVLRHWGE